MRRADNLGFGLRVHIVVQITRMQTPRRTQRTATCRTGQQLNPAALAAEQERHLAAKEEARLRRAQAARAGIAALFDKIMQHKVQQHADLSCADLAKNTDALKGRETSQAKNTPTGLSSPKGYEDMADPDIHSACCSMHLSSLPR